MMEHQAIPVIEMSQTGQARRSAAALAERLGLDSEESGRLGLVVTEAATNLVKHARGGEIVLRALGEETDRAVEILALDRGPGITNMDRALRDGYSGVGSMGGGLGAIIRHSNHFDIYSSESGTILLSRVGASSAVGTDVGTICVPCPGEAVSGDAWAIAEGANRTAVLVVDGLGHGVEAHEAAHAAVAAFTLHAAGAPAQTLERLHEVLRPTRGAAAAILELDGRERMARYAGIGNISGTVIAGGETRSMVSHHGVLGHNVRKVQEFVYPWPHRALVILHSDGIGTHWNLDRYPGLEGRHPTLIAAALYRDHHRQRDDVTVIVLREAA